MNNFMNVSDNVTSNKPPMLPLIFRIQYLIIVLFYAISCTSQFCVFYKVCTTRLKQQLTFYLILNLFIWCCACVSGLVHIGYLLVFSFGSEPFSGPISFWSGEFFYSLGICVSTSLTFLLLNRIVIIFRPMMNNQMNKMYITVTAVVVTFFYGTSSAIATAIIENIPQRTTCGTFSCPLSRTRGLIFSGSRFVISSLNIVLASIFLYKFAKNGKQRLNALQQQQRKKFNNLIAAYAICSEFLFNFLPPTVYLILALSIDQSALGPYPTVFYAFDALVTAVIYRQVILRHFFQQTGIVSLNNQQNSDF
ncbi:hypothetical protein M3Y98_00079600 [Aphelenchoides besseyi]|nr:hypothetical protein M3Y98_00079600 [Aphelenchoides besseyi]